MNHFKLLFTFLCLLVFSKSAIANKIGHLEENFALTDTIKISVDYKEVSKQNIDFVSKKFKKILRKLDNKKIYEFTVKANLPNPFSESAESMKIKISTSGSGKELRDDLGEAWDYMIEELKE